MITFKTFLEAEVKPLSAEKLEVNAELLSFIRKNCSKSIWMFDNATPIWRGERQAQALLGSDGVAVIDTTQSKRSSENTKNWYTTILDNHPAYSDYPKRSESLICTTRWNSARGYAGSDANIIALIPFDTAKIGWVGKGDIWRATVNIDGARESLIGMNDFFNELETLGLNDNDWNSFEKFSEQLKTDERLRRKVAEELKSIRVHGNNMDVNAWLDDFVGKIREAYADLGFKLYTPKSLQSISDNFGQIEGSNSAYEMWVGGKVLCLSTDVFEELAEAGI